MVVTAWLKSLKSLLTKRHQPPRQTRRLQSRLPGRGEQRRIETFEDRTLLAVNAAFFGMDSVLVIESTADDAIVLTVNGGNVLVNGEVPSTGPLAAVDVEAIRVFGSSGENSIDLSSVIVADFPNLTEVVIDGGQGADTIIGSEFADSIIGGHGNDVIVGGLGDDTLNGGDGNDTISAGFGNDLVSGRDGNDQITGGVGDDTLDGGDGEDAINGDIGNDSILGGDGADSIQGSFGNDFINGGFGNDELNGGFGDDTIFGGADNDTLNGNEGDDKLNGQGLDDQIFGGDGSDTLIGGTHNDLIVGGDGNDLIDGDGASNLLWHGDDTIDGGIGDDTIDGNGGRDSIIGSDGNDLLSGSQGDDFIDGSAGDDVIFGNAGADSLFGGGGADTIDGGAGNDLIESGEPPGADVLIFIDDVIIDPEGDFGITNAVFTVMLSQPAESDVVVSFATSDGTATAPEDYLPVSGTLVFAPGETQMTITVPVRGDMIAEMDENFFVDLFSPVGAEFSDDQGMGTIIDDDAVAIVIDDVSVMEGDSGTTVDAVFTVSLVNAATGVPVTAQLPVSVDYMTMDGTASELFDYMPAMGTVTIMPGDPSETITVTVIGDDIAEPNETFFVNLMNPMNATLLDNQGQGTIIDPNDTIIGIFIDDIAVLEGDTGETNVANFTVSTSIPVPAGMMVMVDAMTNDATTMDAATAGTDYTAVAATTLTFMPGEQTQTFSVDIIGDDVFELDEIFFVDLSNAMGGVIVDSQGVGTILNDDTPQFDIVLNFSGTLTPTQMDAFRNAELRWELIITADIPDELNVPNIGFVDDLAIDASVQFIDGPGGILGQAGPTFLRQGSFLPAAGIMQFDSSDLLQLELSGQLESTILHEMAHVLGFGTIWTDLNLLMNPSLQGGTDPRFTGPMATQEYSALTGAQETSVPVEGMMGGPGTLDAHWRESLFTAELMTGFLDAGVANPLSRLTIAQFADLGYQVDLNQADAYTLLQAPPNFIAPTTSKWDDVLRPAKRVLGAAPSTADFLLDTGIGDASVQVQVDGYGSFGSAVGGAETGDAIYDPVGPIGPAGTVFESGVAIRFGSTGVREFLTSGSIGSSGFLPDPTITGDNTTANSMFTFNGLDFDLEQTVGPLTNMAGMQTGSILTQTYTITNPGTMPLNFELVRYIDGDLLFDGTLVDGGGILVTSDGTQILFETDAGGTGSTDTTFLGITGMGGIIPTTNRYEIRNFPNLRDDLIVGIDPQNFIQNDTDGDGFVDPGLEFDVTLALRNLFNLAPGQSVTYITETFWGSGAPEDVGPPQPPPPMVDTIGDHLSGGIGDDTINGGEGNDLIFGQAGNDVIDGNGGNDTIFGGAGQDLIHGGDGNDSLDGGGGTDTVFGDAGNDTISWSNGDGTESVDGGSGFDQLLLQTDSTNDRFFVSEHEGELQVVHRIPGIAIHPSLLEDTLRSDRVEHLAIESDGGADRVEVDDLSGVSDLQLISADLGGGRDVFDASAQLNPAIRISVLGGIGDDTLTGGAGADTLDGQGGNDRIFGGPGDDVLIGGLGVDRIEGGSGNDNIDGGDNRDFINGDAGDDTIRGGERDDVISGGTGNDSIDAGPGNDSVLGEAGDDSITGGDGDDTLLGGSGADTIHGDSPGASTGAEGNDSIAGGDDADVLFGGLGNDTIAGGAGNDSLFGGDGMFVTMRLEPDGDDFLNGNAGDDTIRGEEGNDSLLGGSGNDDMDGGVDNDQLNGNSGNDTMRGGHGDDFMRGGSGNDTMSGGDGNDTLHGQTGDDGLTGNDGADVLNGGGGADTLHGGDGDDTLRGGADKDLLIGHDGQDDLDGQGGSYDTLVGGDSFDILEDNGGTDLIDNDFRFVADWIDAA